MTLRQSSIYRNLKTRARVIGLVRSFFVERGFLEVTVPCRTPAPLPEAHIEAVPSGDWYLHASPESSMKRLLAAGYDRIFTVCPVFRQEERGPRHLPEFTMLEWYRAGADYLLLMDETEALIDSLARGMGLGQSLLFQGENIRLCPPWPRMTVEEAFSSMAGEDMRACLENGTYDEVMAFGVEPNLPRDRPVFLKDYPLETTPLALACREDPDLAQRFELYMGGLEIANAFTELADPVIQAERFEKENQVRASLGKVLYPRPERFLKDLESMPPSAGIALGLDRLVMVFADTASIDEVTAFVPEEL